VIATGFERTGMPRRALENQTSRLEEVPARKPETGEQQTHANKPAEFQPRTFNTEDLDIPTFLRNRTR
jgi:hypothetical protein